MSSHTQVPESLAILRRRCPRCRQGAIFRSVYSMNERCPVCNLQFDRGQPGYFTGAMYVSYGMGIPLITLMTLMEYLLLPQWTLFKLVALAWVLCLPLAPVVWQYSRVLWLHFDRWVDP